MMEKHPLVSIIIPVYNVEQYLEECMESVLQQTYRNLDIILVDDGSRDKSAGMCDRYALQDNRVQVLHKPNGGLMSAWMAGVDISKGEYLAFVDSDDWIEPDMIEKLAGYTDVRKKEIICSNYIIEKKKKSIYMKQSMEPGIYDREDIEKKIIPFLMGQENRRIHCSRCMKLFSRALICENMKYGNPKLTMGEDMNITFPAILDAQRIVVMEEGYFYHYRLVDSSMVHKYNAGLYENNRLLYQVLKEIAESKEKEKKITQKELLLNKIKNEYIFLLLFVLKNELRGTWSGCVQRVCRIAEEADKETDIHKESVRVDGKANRLLYHILKHPGVFNIMFGKLTINVFDRLQR